MEEVEDLEKPIIITSDKDYIPTDGSIVVISEVDKFERLLYTLGTIEVGI